MVAKERMVNCCTKVFIFFFRGRMGVGQIKTFLSASPTEHLKYRENWMDGKMDGVKGND